ncbi:hypothetical protein WGM54_13980 [Paenibacillus polymyxa]|uniref:hypothetical protein n=1 Tax=Paenibacillus polymyxa TaxID=1406 RepID=UPI00307D1FF4
MVIDRLQAFLGLPVKFNDIDIHSPRLIDIANISYMEYLIKLQFCLFNKEKILLDLFQIGEDEYLQIKDTSDFDVLTDHPQLQAYISDALSFFAKDSVVFDSKSQSFKINGLEFINKNNYIHFISTMKELNAVSDESTGVKKKTAKAKLFQDRIDFFKKKTQKKEDTLEIKDILSILCSANGNGIDIFNVGNLTIYQMYEQFERLNIKESFDRLLPVWANGHLSGDTKLPEWIKRTKL